MKLIEEIAKEFLAQKSMTVAGASSKGDTAGNIVLKKLKKYGYKLSVLHPNAQEVDGVKSYPNITSLPELPDVVFIATHPDVTPELLHECGKAGIKRVWIHRSFGDGSYHSESEEIANLYGITLIPGGCPMMFLEPDIIHRCMRWFLLTTGKEALPVIHE
ncbi:MAG: CoA-binding protein [Balneolaceae bacterium]|nr:MAG: CoA-binding protein [Balneolaceae bacterium]